MKRSVQLGPSETGEPRVVTLERQEDGSVVICFSAWKDSFFSARCDSGSAREFLKNMERVVSGQASCESMACRDNPYREEAMLMIHTCGADEGKYKLDYDPVGEGLVSWDLKKEELVRLVESLGEFV